MSETLLSPGLSMTETDKSLIKKQPQEIGAAILGPTTKGPVGIPTIVTSFSEYSAIFGGDVISGSTSYSYLTTISANNYFTQGGKSLLVTRIVSSSNSWSSATSNIPSILNTTSASFVLSTLSQGTINNSTSSENSSGTLASGSIDNVRWEISDVNTGSGTFNLLIRRGDDNARNKNILEAYSGLSLDPLSPNYIERVIGNSVTNVRNEGTEYYVQTTGSYSNSSNYVRVSAVNYKTPNYLKNDGSLNISAYTSSLPRVGSGSFGGATGNLFIGETKFNENITSTNIQGVSPSDYNQSIALLNNTDEYNFNLVTAPGLNYSDHGTQISLLVSLAEARQDCIAVIDLDGYGSTITGITQAAAGINSNYTATYWPWLQTFDPNIGTAVWVPASTLIPGVYAFSDKVGEPWFAPAGSARGALGNAIQAERKLTIGNRNTLYSANVNPILNSSQNGIAVFGQKTLQKQATALDRINVRRLLIELKGYIGQVATNLIFEQNTTATRNSFLSQINPYLESVQQRQGLYAFKVVMDDTNNPADVIDRNELVGQIYIQPAKTIEYILLNFSITPTGVEF